MLTLAKNALHVGNLETCPTHFTSYIYISGKDVSQGFEPLLSHYSIYHFMNEEIVSCEREPYFDQ